MKRLDLTGKTIGYWEVGDSFKKNGKVYYHCKCTLCGKEKDIYGSCLNRGGSLSCGCNRGHERIEDITGQKFGELTAIEKVLIENRTYWKCLCSCGNTKLIKPKDLRGGLVRTCGCRKGTGENIKKAIDGYCVDGTYVPGIKRDSINKNNTSGAKGVSYRADRGKYRAYIKFQRKNIHLGNFDRFADAVFARKEAEKAYYGKYLEEDEA